MVHEEIIESISELILELEIIQNEIICMRDEEEKLKKNKCNEIILNVLQYIKSWRR